MNKTTDPILKAQVITGLGIAAKHIGKGWCTGEYAKQDPICGTRFCSAGAVQEAAGDILGFKTFVLQKSYDHDYEYLDLSTEWEDNEEASELEYGMLDALNDQLRKEGWNNGVIHWNDEQTDKRKVIRLFNRTAKNLAKALG